MQYRWLTVPAHGGSAGSLNNEEEHEAIVHRGVTSCGVERWSIKVGLDVGAKTIRR